MVAVIANRFCQRIIKSSSVETDIAEKAGTGQPSKPKTSGPRKNIPSLAEVGSRSHPWVCASATPNPRLSQDGGGKVAGSAGGEIPTVGFESGPGGFLGNRGPPAQGQVLGRQLGDLFPAVRRNSGSSPRAGLVRQPRIRVGRKPAFRS